MNYDYAVISDTTVLLNNDNQLCALVTFEVNELLIHRDFILEDPLEVSWLKKMMEYLDVQAIQYLKGKRIRVCNRDYLCYGFGHPVKNKFVPLVSKSLMEITLSKFEKLYGNI